MAQVCEVSEARQASRRSGRGVEDVYRVKVCMERFFTDERARVYMCVSARRRVSWLERHLCSQFPLPSRLLLLSNGHLLPPRELLAVLAPDDTVHVLPAREFQPIDSGLGDSNRATPVRDLPTPVVRPATPVIFSATTSPALAFKLQTGDSDPVNADFREPLSSSIDENQLKEYKRRALMKLDELCGGGSEQDESSHVVRPRRRRVRRRRRAVPLSSRTDVVNITATDMQSRMENDHGSIVVHNSYQQSRPPRVIRPLANEALTS